MTRIRTSAAAAIFAIATAASAAPHPFYAQLLQRGKSNVLAGRHEQGLRELRVAAFGLLDHPAEFQTAQVYLAVAAGKLGRTEESQRAATKFLQAQRIAPAKTALAVDATTRTAFDGIVAGVIDPHRSAAPPDHREVTLETPADQPGSR